MSRNAATTLQLDLTMEQGNLVMTALAECPFKLVFELIGKLNRQANAAGKTGDAYVCEVGATEFKLMIEALSKLPYFQVYALVQTLQLQWQAQLQTQLQTPPALGPAGKQARKSHKAGKR